LQTEATQWGKAWGQLSSLAHAMVSKLGRHAQHSSAAGIRRFMELTSAR
jgi:hypothetical protein